MYIFLLPALENQGQRIYDREDKEVLGCYCARLLVIAPCVAVQYDPLEICR